MKKIYTLLLAAIMLPFFAAAQLHNHAVNGNFEESEVGEYGRGGNENNPGWQFLWNNAQFEGLQTPQPFIVDTEAHDGSKSALIVVEELPEEAAQAGQSWFAQVVGFTPDVDENPEDALEPGYYRVSAAFKPIGNNMFLHFTMGNFSFEERARIHNAELTADEWNVLTMVYYNELDARARLSIHYNMEGNLAILPFEFHIDDFRYVQSSLISANVTEDGAELHAVLGWEAAPGTYDGAAFTVHADEDEVAVASAEVLEDGQTLRLVLDGHIFQDQEVHFSFDNSVATIDYLDEEAPVEAVDSFDDEFVVNNSQQEFTSVNDITINNNLIIYPNPVTDEVNVQGVENFSTIRIFAITGQQIVSINNNGSERLTIPVDQLQSGIYILSAENQLGEKKTIRFVK